MAFFQYISVLLCGLTFGAAFGAYLSIASGPAPSWMAPGLGMMGGVMLVLTIGWVR